MPDRFDPLQDLGTTKSMGDAPAPAVPDSGVIRTNAQAFDGAANFGANGHDVKFGDETVRDGDFGSVNRIPPDVNTFRGGV